jgi:hypothetical protein
MSHSIYQESKSARITQFTGVASAWQGVFRDRVLSEMTAEAQEICRGERVKPIAPQKRISNPNFGAFGAPQNIDNPHYSAELTSFDNANIMYSNHNNSGMTILRNHVNPQLHILFNSSKGSLKNAWDLMESKYGCGPDAANNSHQLIKTSMTSLSTIAIYPNEGFETFLMRFKQFAENAQIWVAHDVQLIALLLAALQRPGTPKHLTEALQGFAVKDSYSLQDLTDALSNTDRNYHDNLASDTDFSTTQIYSFSGVKRDRDPADDSDVRLVRQLHASSQRMAREIAQLRSMQMDDNRGSFGGR